MDFSVYLLSANFNPQKTYSTSKNLNAKLTLDLPSAKHYKPHKNYCVTMEFSLLLVWYTRQGRVYRSLPVEAVVRCEQVTDVWSVISSSFTF